MSDRTIAGWDGTLGDRRDELLRFSRLIIGSVSHALVIAIRAPTVVVAPEFLI
ncbi:hypothetical protein [Leifsonia sp. EB34]|uniref:hypothetical protein n=1 Tax=Leifsonia sp. EB34 TaxID=3156303 RepID=UPI003510F8A1